MILTGKVSYVNNGTTLPFGSFSWLVWFLFSELGTVRALPLRLRAGLEVSHCKYREYGPKWLLGFSSCLKMG